MEKAFFPSDSRSCVFCSKFTNSRVSCSACRFLSYFPRAPICRIPPRAPEIPPISCGKSSSLMVRARLLWKCSARFQDAMASVGASEFCERNTTAASRRLRAVPPACPTAGCRRRLWTSAGCGRGLLRTVEPLRRIKPATVASFGDYGGPAAGASGPVRKAPNRRSTSNRISFPGWGAPERSAALSDLQNKSRPREPGRRLLLIFLANQGFVEFVFPATH